MDSLTLHQRPIAMGISILEVLISMGILAVGLLSVAALFPVGQHYVLSAQRYDRGAAVGQAAFNEIRTRGMLQPRFDYFKRVDGTPFPNPNPIGRTDLSGLSLAVDSLWCAVNEGTGPVSFPPGYTYPPTPPNDPPVMARAMILPDPSVPPVNAAEWQMVQRLFEQLFTSHDDLISEFPEDPDLPSFQLFKRDNATNMPVHRQYAGDYSWMFTVVPEVNHDDGLDHSTASKIDLYRVSVVVFYKRQLDYTDPLVDPDQPERLVGVAPLDAGGNTGGIGRGLSDGLGSGEILLTSQNPLDLDGMKAGEWLMLSGWQPAGSDFLPIHKWYRIVAVEDEIDELPSGNFIRWVTVLGPDWNKTFPTWVTLIDGVVAVYQKTMRIDEF